MRGLFLAAAMALALLASGCGGQKSGATTAGQKTAPPSTLSEGPFTEFGYIKSLTRFGSGYKLKLDLHVRGAGLTDLHACIDNGDCPKGTQGIPDDIFDMDLHFLLTYRVPADARVKMVRGITLVSITPAQLYELAHGRKLPGLRLMEPDTIGFGFYIEYTPEVGFDRAARIEQVYHP